MQFTYITGCSRYSVSTSAGTPWTCICWCFKEWQPCSIQTLVVCISEQPGRRLNLNWLNLKLARGEQWTLACHWPLAALIEWGVSFSSLVITSSVPLKPMALTVKQSSNTSTYNLTFIIITAPCSRPTAWNSAKLIPKGAEVHNQHLAAKTRLFLLTEVE